jgi:hypothetical protein
MQSTFISATRIASAARKDKSFQLATARLVFSTTAGRFVGKVWHSPLVSAKWPTDVRLDWRIADVVEAERLREKSAVRRTYRTVNTALSKPAPTANTNAASPGGFLGGSFDLIGAGTKKPRLSGVGRETGSPKSWSTSLRTTPPHIAATRLHQPYSRCASTTQC